MAAACSEQACSSRSQKAAGCPQQVRMRRAPPPSHLAPNGRLRAGRWLHIHHTTAPDIRRAALCRSGDPNSLGWSKDRTPASSAVDSIPTLL
jgi:hypothetical protein